MEEVGQARSRLGEMMRFRRLERGLSVRAAAQLADVDRATWASAEAGTRDVREHNRAGIERALGWAVGSVEAILKGGTPEQASAAPEASAPEMDIEYEIGRVMSLDVSAEVKRRLVNKMIDLYQEIQAERQQG